MPVVIVDFYPNPFRDTGLGILRIVFGLGFETYAKCTWDCNSVLAGVEQAGISDAGEFLDEYLERYEQRLQEKNTSTNRNLKPAVVSFDRRRCHENSPESCIAILSLMRGCVH